MPRLTTVRRPRRLSYRRSGRRWILTSELACLTARRFALTGGLLFLFGRDLVWILRDVLKTLAHSLEHVSNELLVRNTTVSLLLFERVVKFLELLGRVIGQLRSLRGTRT